MERYADKPSFIKTFHLCKYALQKVKKQNTRISQIMRNIRRKFKISTFY